MHSFLSDDSLLYNNCIYRTHVTHMNNVRIHARNER